MDRRLVPFQRWHMAWLQDKGAAMDGQWGYSAELLRELEKQNCWTAVVNGDPIACGGTMQQWPGRHMAWAYMNAGTRPHMLFLTREVQKGLNKIDGRIEFTVRRDYKQGHHWARILGFRIENEPGILRAYGPEGEDHVAYVRFNKR